MVPLLLRRVATLARLLQRGEARQSRRRRETLPSAVVSRLRVLLLVRRRSMMRIGSGHAAKRRQRRQCTRLPAAFAASAAEVPRLLAAALSPGALAAPCVVCLSVLLCLDARRQCRGGLCRLVGAWDIVGAGVGVLGLRAAWRGQPRPGGGQRASPCSCIFWWRPVIARTAHLGNPWDLGAIRARPRGRLPRRSVAGVRTGAGASLAALVVLSSLVLRHSRPHAAARLIVLLATLVVRRRRRAARPLPLVADGTRRRAGRPAVVPVSGGALLCGLGRRGGMARGRRFGEAARPCAAADVAGWHPSDRFPPWDCCCRHAAK